MVAAEGNFGEGFQKPGAQFLGLRKGKYGGGMGVFIGRKFCGKNMRIRRSFCENLDRCVPVFNVVSWLKLGDEEWAPPVRKEKKNKNKRKRKGVDGCYAAA
jgi:hypothetical protein